MDTTHRHAGDSLEPSRDHHPLLDAASRHHFFTLVALLERMTPGAQRVGGDGPPHREVIRFRHGVDMAFDAGDVRDVKVQARPMNEASEHEAAFDVVTTFLGLAGAVTPLPLYLAEEVQHEDSSASVRRDFLDIFHHRLLSLLYRAVIRYSPAREPSRYLMEGIQGDRWIARTLGLSGLYLGGGQLASRLPPARLLRLVPLLVRRGRSARTLALALKVVLEPYLGNGATVRVRELQVGWMKIDANQEMRLGQSGHQLGGMMLGQTIRDGSGRFAICIGPLTDASWRSFQKAGTTEGEGLTLLRETVKLVVRRPLEYDVELELAADTLPPFRLADAGASMLGLNTGLGCSSRPRTVVIRDARRCHDQDEFFDNATHERSEACEPIPSASSAA